MSWSQFENSVVGKMESNGLKSPEEFAKFFAKKYDECIKSGQDLVTKNKINKGNVQLMEELIKLTLIAAGASASTSVYDSYFNSFGNAVIAYWTGGVLHPAVLPLTPAVGSNYNIAVTSINVSSPGVWPAVKIPPMKSARKFVKQFISLAKIHLASVSGICQTSSAFTIYNTILPGFLTWTGYKVPDMDAVTSPIALFSNMLLGGKKVTNEGELSHKGQAGWQSGNAIDIVTDVGTRCYSPIEGVVVNTVDYGPTVIERNGKRLFGYGVRIRAIDGREVYMAHMQNKPAYIMLGTPIAKGAFVGEVMPYPFDSTFNHLHIGFIDGTSFKDYMIEDGKGSFL